MKKINISLTFVLSFILMSSSYAVNIISPEEYADILSAACNKVSPTDATINIKFVDNGLSTAWGPKSYKINTASGNFCNLSVLVSWFEKNLQCKYKIKPLHQGESGNWWGTVLHVWRDSFEIQFLNDKNWDCHGKGR